MDETIYKRNEYGKKLAKDVKTMHKKIRFRNKDIEIDRIIKIGRSRENDIVIIDDPMVSRRHALIEQKGDIFYLIDKDSTNGTFLNNSPIPKGGRCELKSGDIIKLGKTILEII